MGGEMTTPRRLAESGFYHVVLKGNAGQLIFEGDSDRLRFISFLEKTKERYPLRVHAWCLMSNHVHLLVEDAERCLAQSMDLLAGNYAKYFNRRTGRTGAVFSRSFWSEPIEDESYLLSTMNYIHNNPQAAGICSADAYRWSSYRAYALGSQHSRVTDTSLLLGMLGGTEGFKEFSENHPSQAVPFFGSKLRNHLNDDEAFAIARGLVGKHALDNVKGYAPQDRRPIIQKLLRSGLTSRHVQRLTGLSSSQIQSAKTDSH